MRTKEQLKKISETYFQALGDKDFSAINYIAFKNPDRISREFYMK